MWINIICQWCAVWNTKLQRRCKGRKLSSLYLQIFIIKKQHLAYSFIVQAESLSWSRRLSNLRFSTDTQHLLKHLQLFCTFWYGCRKQIQKRALPKANGNWAAKAWIICQWVKVLSYSCKTTKFNWNPKICSNRTMCGKFRIFFFYIFVYFKGSMELGWNQRRTTEVLRQVCLSHSGLLQAHSSKGNTHIYITVLYIPHVQQHSSINSKSKTAKYTFDDILMSWFCMPFPKKQNTLSWFIKRDSHIIFFGSYKQALYEQCAYKRIDWDFLFSL